MHTLAKGTITVPNPAGDAAVNNTNKRVISENYAPCTDCMTKINNTEVDNAEDIDIVVSIYNLIEYSDAYSKASESVWRYYRDEPALDNNNNIADFHAADNSSYSFKFQQKITGQTENSETKDVEVMLPLKYLSNFWKTLDMPLIDCEVTLQWTSSKKSILVAGTAANQKPKFKITNTKLYVPIVTLSTQKI